MTAGRRYIPSRTYLFFYTIFAAVLFLIHTPFLKLPYLWDEVGVSIPAALDLFKTGAWIPHAHGFSAHPPGVMAFLAACWSLAGHSIPVTRVAMLLMASAGLLVVFLLAIRLAENLQGTPAFVVVMLMVVSPLFYTQSIMALADLPAMLFTCLALLLFLQDRQAAAAAACTMLVLVKETGLIVPLVLGGWLLAEKRLREAVYFLAPLCAFAAWILEVKKTSGSMLGNYPFTRDNLLFLVNPVRFPAALLQRLYYLFVAEFRWIGTLAILAAWRKGAFRMRDWRIAAGLLGAHVLLFSLYGSAMLPRYLLPVLPIVYMAMVAGFFTLSRNWRLAGQFGLALGLLAGNFWDPPYPAPLEDNTAFADFVTLQKTAAEFLEFNYTGRRILTAWPLGSALTRPEFGYVQRALQVEQIPDFRGSTLGNVDWLKVDILVLYSRYRDPEWNLLSIDLVRRFAERWYDYHPDLAAPPAGVPLEHVGHWAQRGQWVDVYAHNQNPEVQRYFRIGGGMRK
jgi:Dolichyl-phosphate-mannose-protein mannosyltransferase